MAKVMPPLRRVLAPFVVALASCPPLAMYEGKTCPQGVCPDDLVCVDGVCVAPCAPEALGFACTVGLGACARSATWECAADVRRCPTQPGAPADEQCNGADDDCDGVLDDLADAGEACVGGLGVCTAPGAFACVDGGWACVSDGEKPSPELCNGLDDDCDGWVDDGCLSTVAGSGPPGWVDGPWAAAQFQRPQMLVSDALGNVFVADSANNRVRAIWADGGVTTLAGNGACAFADGPGPTASFCQPLGIELLRNSDLAVSDARNRRVRVIRSPRQAPTVVTMAIDAGFSQPRGLHLTADGGLLVSDPGAHRVFYVNPVDGGLVKVIGLGSSGTGNGQWNLLQLNQPVDAVQADDGLVYVSEAASHRIRIVPLGGAQSSTLAGSGSATTTDGVGVAAAFNAPGQLSLDRDAGRLLLIESSGSALRSVPLDGGRTSTLARNLPSPSGLTRLDDETVVVSELNGLRRYTLIEDGGVSISPLITPQVAYSDGDAAVARLDDPDRMVEWPAPGFLAWSENRTVRLMYVDAGRVITVAGPPPNGQTMGVDGPLFNGGWLDRPVDLKAGPDGGLYVTDAVRDTVRVIDRELQRIDTFAGPGARVDATFRVISLLAFGRSPQGEDLLYVAEGNGSTQNPFQLRRFGVQSGSQVRLAGLDSGVALSAPSALVTGAGGELYLVDNDPSVRRFELDGGVRAHYRLPTSENGVRSFVFDERGLLVWSRGRRVWRSTADGGSEVLFDSATYSDSSSISGLADGPPKVGILWSATSLVLVGENVFLTDQLNNRIRLLKLPHR
ncbi:MAG: hypothetical protein IPJ65_24850 [Archangiaceae bacterium]|nr:hypothetical protein [Archangiaceae bacterium]